MCEISDLIFDLSKDIYKKNIENSMMVYNNPEYEVKKIYRDGALIGFFAKREVDGIVWLEEGYYKGGDKLEFFRVWRKHFDKNKIYRTTILKVNEKLINFYKKIGFKIIFEDSMSYTFEYNKNINIKEYSELIFNCMQNIFKGLLEKKTEIYNDKNIIKKEYRERGILKGLFIYKIKNGVCDLFETHNISNNKNFIYKNFMSLFKNKNIRIIKVVVQENNFKVLKFYKKLGFIIIKQDLGNVFLEYRRQ